MYTAVKHLLNVINRVVVQLHMVNAGSSYLDAFYSGRAGVQW